jgi:hypothetical protein
VRCATRELSVCDWRHVSGLECGIASATGGTLGDARGLVADSPKLAAGNLLYAFAYEHEDGPSRNPDYFGKYTGVLKYSTGMG